MLPFLFCSSKTHNPVIKMAVHLPVNWGDIAHEDDDGNGHQQPIEEKTDGEPMEPQDSDEKEEKDQAIDQVKKTRGRKSKTKLTEEPTKDALSMALKEKGHELSTLKSNMKKGIDKLSSEKAKLIKDLNTIKAKAAIESATMTDQINSLIGDKDDMKSGMDVLKSDINTLTANFDELEEKISILQTENNQLTLENDAIRNVRNDLKSEAVVYCSKIANLEIKLREEKEIVEQAMQSESFAKVPKANKIVIMVATHKINSNMVAGHLSKLKSDFTWDVTDDLDTAEEMLIKMKQKSYLKKIKRCGGIIILMGLHEIVINGKNTIDTYETIEQLAKELAKYTKVFVSETTPTDNMAYNSKVLNSHLSRIPLSGNNISVIHLTDAYDEIPRFRSVVKNTFTLTDEGGEACAKWLVKEVGINDSDVVSYDKSESENEDETEPCDIGVMRLPKDKVRFFIGPEGSTIKKLQEETNTKLRKITFRDEFGESTCALLIGDRESRKMARGAIRDVINESDSVLGKRKICRFYQEGDCRSGQYCRFRHDKSIHVDRKVRKY